MKTKTITHEISEQEIEIEWTRGDYLAGSTERVYEAIGYSSDGTQWLGAWLESMGEFVRVEGVHPIEDFEPSEQELETYYRSQHEPK